MLLAVDVGNSNIVPGVFDGPRLIHSWRLATLRERTADEVGIMLTQLFAREGLDSSSVTAAIIASVVPPLTPTLVTMARQYFSVPAIVIDQTIDTGMPNRYENPAEVGADRIVNGVAAYEEFGRPGRCAVIVVDFGTATTFDAISAAGEYLGGVICPGIQISADALFQRAARLPRVEVRKPAGVIGRNTVASMQSGLFFGYVDMVEGLVGRMRQELGDPVMCVATGGLAEVISAETTVIQRVSPDLTLNGLRIIWERQRG